MKLNILFLTFLLLTGLSSFSQNNSEFKVKELKILSLLQEVNRTENNEGKMAKNDSVSLLLSSILQNPESFNYPFDSLKHFGKLTAPDQSFRIITWNTILADGTNTYNGFIQVYSEKKMEVYLFPLIDRASEVEKRENSVLSAGKWYGALYYYILEKKVNQVTYYTLLALRYNDLFTTSKIIEILYFDEFGNPVFGSPLFTDGKSMKLRMVYEYSANVSMNLKYDEKLKMIIFDHLSPEDNRFVGHYDKYGPDLTFDGFQFKNKKWTLITNLDIKQTDNTSSDKVKRVRPQSNKIIGR